MEKILKILKKSNKSFETHPCTNGAALVKMRDCSYGDFTDISAFIRKEYDYYAHTDEGNVSFVTFAEHGKIINLSYSENDKTIRAVCENGKYLPPREWEAGDSKGLAPLVTQLRTPYFTNDCGMTYVIRLSDGRFVIVDGGVGEYDETEHLMEVLSEQNELDKITVAAWFITHAHMDHFGGFVQVMDRYSEKIVLERLVYNWALPEMTCATSPLADFNRVVENLKNTQIITARSGQKYHFSDTEITMLYVCEDLYPAYISTLNDTSTVFRMTICGRRVMFLGDVMGQGADFITARYGEETLRSEILQVGHHGYWGGSHKLHSLINPETLLWPCPDFWYQEIKDWDCNRYFKESKNIKHKYICGREEVTLDMTKPVPDTQPYKKENDIILNESFDQGSVMALKMSCITGGSTGYRAPQVEVAGNVKMRFSSADAYSLMELVQPEFMRDEKKVRLTVSGSKENAGGKLGLIFNNPHPTVWSDIKFLRLDAGKDEAFEYALELDLEKGKGTLYKNGEMIKNLEFVVPDRPCGIYLVMRNAKVVLDKVKLISM